jgi:hypothetical protein
MALTLPPHMQQPGPRYQPLEQLAVKPVIALQCKAHTHIYATYQTHDLSAHALGSRSGQRAVAPCCIYAKSAGAEMIAGHSAPPALR